MVVDVSINIIVYHKKFLKWSQYQIKRLIEYSNKFGITTELLIVSHFDPSYLKDFPKHRFYRCNENDTIGTKRNILLDHSNGRFVCIADEDDVHLRYRIKLCIELFKSPQLKDVMAITTKNIFTYDIHKKNSFYLKCESESALFLKRVLYKHKGRRFGTEDCKGEGNNLFKGEKLYLENERLMMIALRHGDNYTNVNSERDLGDIDEYLDTTEKELLNEL